MRKIEVLRTGKYEDETFVVLIDGVEIGNPIPKAAAHIVAQWLRDNITKLEGVL
jgi:hypothetical protein